MTVRHALAAATVVGSLAASTSVPALAQQAQTFEAWGHTFNVPGASFGVPAVVARDSAVRTSRPIGPNSSYASASVGTAVASTNSQQTVRTINVWGARLNVPAY
jgi:hypothetical protein